MESLIFKFGSPIVNHSGEKSFTKFGFHKIQLRRLEKLGFISRSFPPTFSCCSSRNDHGVGDPPSSLQELRVPSHWLQPSKALEVALTRHHFCFISVSSGSICSISRTLVSLDLFHRFLTNSTKLWQESEWLRIELEKWLDEEYCPEATNAVISKVAAESFHWSLVENRVDLGEILLKMAVDLDTISYRESFHGAFSSANAAVNLIIQRMSHQL